MIPAPLPDNEQARLAALRSYELLDSRAERAFDDLVHLTAESYGVPMALISLMDADRQWFKAKCGLDACQTDRDLAFCAHAILKPSHLLVIPDARDDPRFSGNPLVTGPPHIRFYAGCPLVDPDGYAIGTLCIIDTQPRELTEAEQDRLRLLARLVMDQAQARKTARAAAHHYRLREKQETELAELRERLAEFEQTAVSDSIA
ncbi:MAG: GAF domain-containing protein [Planctomycetota bacterium]